MVVVLPLASANCCGGACTRLIGCLLLALAIVVCGTIDRLVVCYCSHWALLASFSARGDARFSASGGAASGRRRRIEQSSSFAAELLLHAEARTCSDSVGRSMIFCCVLQAIRHCKNVRLMYSTHIIDFAYYATLSHVIVVSAMAVLPNMFG